MKKRMLSLALCLVLVVGLFSGLTVNASASRLDDLKKEIAERLIKEKIEQLKEEFEIPDLDTDAIISSFTTAATSGDFGENSCLHWEVSTGVLSGKTLTISGTGAMPDFDFPNGNLAPWWNYEALGMLTSFGTFKLEGELKKVVIKDGAHTWDNGTVTTEPTETTPGVRTFTCAVCGATRTETIPATGAHDYQFTKNVAPTCTTEGYDLYTCSGCGATEKRNSKPALGHKWDSGTVTTEPTETTPGVRTYTCTVCGATRTETIPATGAHTHVWDNGTVTIAPTETTPGVRTYTCTVCGQTKNEIIPATGGSSVCPGGPSCPSYGFSDVAGPNDWSHEGIDYCVRRSLMVGTGAGTFSPGMNCSRAQIVQILYNLSGDKTDYSRYYLPFTDVTPGAWYYDAVAWAYFNNVVSGTSETTFAPNDVITREQMAVILYGYTAEFAPEFTGNAASLNTFPDAGSVANWAYAAMSWAVGNGLISGMGSGGVSYLAPQGSATRAQASAIIMRYCQLIGQ